MFIIYLFIMIFSCEVCRMLVCLPLTHDRKKQADMKTLFNKKIKVTLYTRKIILKKKKKTMMKICMTFYFIV